jgi:hypothetical protein
LDIPALDAHDIIRPWGERKQILRACGAQDDKLAPLAK